MTSVPLRGQYGKTTVRRREIIDAAVQVFSAAGFRKGSLRDVAALTGLSQPGLLHHFPTKSLLLMAVLEWRDQDTLSRIGHPQPAGVDLLRAMLLEFERNARLPELVELHVTMSAEATSPDHPAHDYFVRRYALLRDVLQTAFEHAAACGDAAPDLDCVAAATSVIALMDGLQVQWLLDRDAIDMAVGLRRGLQTLLTDEL